MQAVILAAGKSSRFYPYNNKEHKSFVTVLGKPLIEHTLLSLKESGIQNVVIVVKPDSIIKTYLGDGSTYGMSLQYVIQQSPQGMGNALLLAKNLLEEKFFLLSGYHVEFGTFAKDMIRAHEKNDGCVVLAKESSDIAQYATVEIKDGVVREVLEKVHKDGVHKRLIAIYLLTKKFLTELEETKEAEYQFEDALSSFAKKEDIQAVVTNEKTVSLKFPWHLLPIKDYLLSQLKGKVISSSASVAKNAIVTGDVLVDEGATIMEGVVVKGPAYIGKNVVIGNNVVLRNGVSIEEGAVIGSGMEVKNSLVMNKATTHSGFIGDSIIGEKTKVAGYVCTANVRLDRKPVIVEVKGEQVNSGMNHLGSIVGSGVNLGIRVSIMPGIIIGNNCIIGPSTTVMKNIADDTKYYTKFSEIVEKK